MSKLSVGKVQVYTGNGKGKTTASLGLVLRAAGAGMQIYFGQFMKKGNTSEIRALRDFLSSAVTVEQYGQRRGAFRPRPRAGHRLRPGGL